MWRAVAILDGMSAGDWYMYLGLIVRNEIQFISISNDELCIIDVATAKSETSLKCGSRNI